jgi:DNA-binding transcriptional regulator YhcF (GntR family)
MLLNLTELSAEPLYRQISRQLVCKMLTEELTAGDELPPVRVLAREQRVNRNTVKRAYDELAEHGLITHDPGGRYLVTAPRSNGTHPVFVENEGDLRGMPEGDTALEPGFDVGIYTSSLDTQQIEEELRLAHQLQADLLPGEWDNGNGSSLAAYTSPCHTVGGDFYDYFPIDDTRLGLVVGDASGRGLPAAILISQIQAILKNCVGNGDTIARTLASLNGHLEKNTASGYFATLFYGIYHRDTGNLEYANAGHDFPILVRAGGEIEVLESTGTALGVLPEYDQRTETVRVGPGDCILFYTDGITDATDTNGEQYGMGRLKRLIHNNHHRTPREIVDLLRNDLSEFCGTGTDQDDRTLMVFKVEYTDERKSDAA